MARITDLMKELDFPTSEGGVCQGLALMAERARHLGQYPKFKERMTYLSSLEIGALKGLIKSAKDRAKAKETLIGDDAILLTLEPFFFQVLAHFGPRDIQRFFSIPGAFFSQTDIRKVEELLHEEQPLALPISYFFSLKSTKQGKYDKGDHLLHFLKTIKKSSLSIGLMISSGHHAVHLFYDRSSKRWFFTNYDHFSDYESTKSVLNPLLEALTKNGTANLTFKLFTDEPAYKKT